MKPFPSRRVSFAALVSFLVTVFPMVTATAAVEEPRLELRASSDSVTLQRFGRQPLWIDLGVYIAALDAPFELRAVREDYSEPVRLYQVLHGNSPSESVALPDDILDGWFGLADFFRLEIFSPAGLRLRDRNISFCPASYERQRINDLGPDRPVYPDACYGNPFSTGMVWGIEEGWAIDPLVNLGVSMRLRPGSYQARFSIAPRYVELFDLGSAVSVDLDLEVVEEECPEGCYVEEAPSKTQSVRGSAIPETANPNPATLPDLMALPAWGISVQQSRARTRLAFGATVWNGGAQPLVVEGFRRADEEVMDAYQYFYNGDEPVARAPAGTMEFDDRRGHQHWHFLQFARYSLLDATQSQVLVSKKEAFCLAPTDPVDLTVPNADWRPGNTGLATACGGNRSLWIREILPLGWGDTYFQGIPGQSFDITDLPNGTYFIRLEVNPLGALHELSVTNNSEVREVIIGGEPGARTVAVPPWNGIDSESAFQDRGTDPASTDVRNGRIAFIRGSLAGRTDVASLAASGRELRNLTRSDANELYADVSPDGQMVAFSRFGRNGGEIYTVPIGGGTPTRLTRDRVNDELPIWSPDSSRIAFVRYPGGDDAEIFVMDADGSNRVRVTDNDDGDADPRWSPDGTQLIYNSGNIDDNTQDVFLVSLETPGALTLTAPGVNDSFAEWSSDGTEIVYASYRDDHWDLYSVTRDGATTTQLTDDPVDEYQPKWSPDGTKLLYVRGRLEGELPPDEVYVMNTDGGGKTRLSPGRLNAFSPSWAPNGERVVFIGQVGSEGGPNWEIFTVAVDGSDRRRLTRSAAMEFDPSWARRP